LPEEDEEEDEEDGPLNPWLIKSAICATDLQ